MENFVDKVFLPQKVGRVTSGKTGTLKKVDAEKYGKLFKSELPAT
jgi:hypothetical protein